MMLRARLRAFGIKLKKGFSSFFKDKIKAGHGPIDSVVYVAMCVSCSIFTFSY